MNTVPPPNRCRRGFTLIEVVLAIGLSSVLLYLLTSAVDLYLAHEDRNRARVESAQLARQLLDLIAQDLAAIRWDPPPLPRPAAAPSGDGTAAGAAGQGTSGGGTASGTGGTGANAGANAGGGFSAAATAGGAAPRTPPSPVTGTELELRIDRSAANGWYRTTRTLLPDEAAATDSVPLTVRYFLGEGDYRFASQQAAAGVDPEATDAVAGLYREILPTAALGLLEDSSPVGGNGLAGLGDSSQLDLLAPEVVEISYSYYDGAEMLDTWDPTQQEGTPQGVEIRLVVLTATYEAAQDRDKQARYRDGRFAPEDVVEYRRFVRLAEAQLPTPAQPLWFSAAQPAQGSRGPAGRGGGGENSAQAGDVADDPGAAGGGNE
jgi:prepilin-type N-terminal cleavage/methylation domain-containing protein